MHQRVHTHTYSVPQVFIHPYRCVTRTCTYGIHGYTYIHTYIHTYIDTYTQTNIHTYKQTYRHTYIHTYIIHIYIHTYIHTYIHAYMHTYIHTYIHTREGIHTCTQVYLHKHACLFIYYFFSQKQKRIFAMNIGQSWHTRETNSASQLRWFLSRALSLH